MKATSSGLFNIDFGPWRENDMQRTGAAAIGKEGDHWNLVAKAFNDAHTEDGLNWADGKPSPIHVEMRNLGGGWSAQGKMGIRSPMLDDYNYPAGNKGGNSYVLLHGVPEGVYDLLIYGHGKVAGYFGDYQVKIGEKEYGRKSTYAEDNRGQDTKWIEGRQYVKFSRVRVQDGAPIEIKIRPGDDVEAEHGPTIQDAIIAGLQLVRK